MTKNRLKTTLLVSALAVFAIGPLRAEGPKTIKLNAPNRKGGLPVMEALSVRASARSWSAKELSLQELADLLWAANGINRPESKKRTAPSAMNAQDVDIYVFMKDGAYLYDPAQQALNPITPGDHREEITRLPEDGPVVTLSARPEAPIQIILVSDISRFKAGTQDVKLQWAAIDAGIVSQNISLFCAGAGLVTRPRTDMNMGIIKTLLRLNDNQFPILNQPVGYRETKP